MRTENAENIYNPLSDLIDDEIFTTLNSRGLINERSIRDYEICREFRYLRSKKIKTGDAIEMIREKYPYLQFDTVRKIVYRNYL